MNYILNKIKLLYAIDIHIFSGNLCRQNLYLFYRDTQKDSNALKSIIFNRLKYLSVIVNYFISNETHTWYWFFPRHENNDNNNNNVLNSL